MNQQARSRGLFAAAAISVAGFSILAVGVHDPQSVISRVDDAFASAILFPGPAWASFMRTATRLADPRSVLAILAVIISFAAARKRLDLAWFAVATFASSSLTVRIMKQIFERARPEPGQLLHASFAFPSGHAAAGLTAGLTVSAILLWLEVRAARAWAVSVIALGLLVGYTRVYLSVHWLSDVVAGWCVSIAVVSTALALTRRRLRRERGLTMPITHDGANERRSGDGQ